MWTSSFRALDAGGHPRSAIDTLWARGPEIGLDFAIGRHAVVTSGGSTGPPWLVAFDRAGTLATAREEGFGGELIDIGRLEIAHRWIAVASLGPGVGAYAVDDDMRPDGEPLVVTPREPAVVDVRVAGVKSRALVVWTTPDGVTARALRAPPLATDGEPFRVMSVAQVSDSAIAVEVFRNLVGVVAMDGRDVHVALVDAWAREVRGGPLIVGHSGIIDRRPGLAVSPEHGFFVVCWAVGPGPAGGSGNDGVALQVVGADGTLFGAHLDLVEHEGNIGGVDCGWNGREIVVVWWRAGGDTAWNTLYAQRVRPTFI